jgi:hypothetical protein
VPPVPETAAVKVTLAPAVILAAEALSLVVDAASAGAAVTVMVTTAETELAKVGSPL